MPLAGATCDEKMGGARVSADAPAAIGRLNRSREIAAGDSGSHFPGPFSGARFGVV